MDTRTTRAKSWLTSLAVILAVILGLVIAAVGVLITVDSTNEPIHPSPEGVTSRALSTPAPQSSRAVEQGRLLARSAVTEQNLPGMSVAVGVAGEIVWAEGFGFGSLETRTPVGPRTRFRIGHVSKALTSVGVGLLREQGRLHLDEQIQAYVPAFPAKERPITVRQLMGHTAGIGHYRDTEWGDKPKVHCDRAADGLRSFSAAPLLFEPGSRTIEGASTSFLTFPDRGLVVAVSANISFADMKSVAMGIARLFAEEQPR